MVIWLKLQLPSLLTNTGMVLNRFMQERTSIGPKNTKRTSPSLMKYGAGTANALQRGFGTHTKNGLKYFDSVTGGWIDYSHNHLLVKPFSHALLSTSNGHEAALLKLKEDIEEQKRHSQLR